MLVDTLGGINLKTNEQLCLKKKLIDDIVDIDRILNNILLILKKEYLASMILKK